MANEMQVFKYKEQQVRTTEIDGEIWFVAKDVADILGFEDATHAIRGLDEDEKGLQKVETLRGMQDMTIISEAGLYTLLMRSNKTEAKSFRRWVTHEVLPSIRKHGMYLTDEALKAMKIDPERFERVLKLYAEAREREQELKKELEETRPFTNLGRIVLAQSGSVSMQSAAHFLCQHGFETGQNRLFRLF
ncbi:MAG: Bro-N domain-containing protein, partial [Synergistaceae bacterium]|nr:Bro-N domain-containing protein [Synergistaceae bacterium]